MTDTAAPFSVAECNEIGRLVRQALDPSYLQSQAEWEAYRATLPTLSLAEMDLDDWQAMDPLARAAEVHTVVPAGATWVDDVMEHHHVGFVTSARVVSPTG